MGTWLFACYEMQATPTLVIMAMAYIMIQFCLMNIYEPYGTCGKYSAYCNFLLEAF